eukprot:s2072_g30.t1
MPDQRIPAEREIPRAPDAHDMVDHPPPIAATSAPESDAVTIIGVTEGCSRACCQEDGQEERQKDSCKEDAIAARCWCWEEKLQMIVRVKERRQLGRVLLSGNLEDSIVARLGRTRRSELLGKRGSVKAKEWFSQQREDEESRPVGTITVEKSREGKRVIRRKSFNPKTGRAETLEIRGVGETSGGGLIPSLHGFSQKPIDRMKCGHCGQFGHLVSMCPEIQCRVSLSSGAIVLMPRAGTIETSEAGDDVMPDDSVSAVAAQALTSESLKAHNKRMRGHGWGPEVRDLPAVPEFHSSAAAVARPTPPSHPPPGWKANLPMPPTPPTPPPVPAPLPPPSTPPPAEKSMPASSPPKSSGVPAAFQPPAPKRFPAKTTGQGRAP